MIRRIFVAQIVCPLCEREHYFESEEQIEPIKPDKFGLGALCGSCEAQRRCWYVGGGKTTPFWDDVLEARAWANIRMYPNRYQIQTWETEPHDQPLRDDQRDKLLALIGISPAKPGYPIRYKYRWTEEEMRAKGIDWTIPNITPTF